MSPFSRSIRSDNYARVGGLFEKRNSWPIFGFFHGRGIFFETFTGDRTRQSYFISNAFSRSKRHGVVSRSKACSPANGPLKSAGPNKPKPDGVIITPLLLLLLLLRTNVTGFRASAVDDVRQFAVTTRPPPRSPSPPTLLHARAYIAACRCRVQYNVVLAPFLFSFFYYVLFRHSTTARFSQPFFVFHTSVTVTMKIHRSRCTGTERTARSRRPMRHLCAVIDARRRGEGRTDSDIPLYRRGLIVAYPETVVGL